METIQMPQEVREDGQPSPKKKKGRLPSVKLPKLSKLSKKQKKWLKIGAVLVVAGVGLFWATHRPDPGAGVSGQYTPEAVQRRDLTSTVSGTGTVAPIDSYQVRALVTGEVLDSPFEVGDQVEKGALLYRFDAGSAEAAIQQAEAAVKQAQLNVEQSRLSEQQAQRGIGQAERGVDQAERGVDQAQRGVGQAGKTVGRAQEDRDAFVSKLTVRAEEAGVVQQVLVHMGDLVSPGTPVAEIADNSVLKLTVPFHSADAQQIGAGQSAQVTIAGTMETLPAVVESISEADMPGTGGTLVRQVTFRLDNPGVLTSADSATAAVGDIACAGSATFQENARRTITAQSSGQVTELPIAVGSRVAAGSVLAVLGGSTVQSSLNDLDRATDTARDSVATAQDGVTTAQDAVASAQDAVVTARDAVANAKVNVKNAQLSLENAQLSLQSARDALDNYTVTAPISGTVIEKSVKAGDKVDGIESGTMAVIYDMSCLKLEMTISELDLNKVHPGQRVEITADAIPGETFIGTVDRVSINGTTTNGFTTYPVTILLEEYGGLNPGMNVSADIIVEETTQTLSIPASAVQRGDTVLIPLEGTLSEDGTAVIDPTKVEERTVELGGGDGEYVEVLSGLEEGETVLMPAQSGMDDGAPGGGSAAVS